MKNLWLNFSAAPHRMMFFGGVFQAVAIMLWWLTDLAGRFGGAYDAIAWSVPPIWGHLFLMLYGFFTFFIFGFLMTTYPNWLGGPKIPPRLYVPAFVALFGGVLLSYAGLFAGRALLAAGVVLMLIGWGISLYALIRVLVVSPPQDKRHPIITTIALTMGWLGLLAYLLWLLTDTFFLLGVARSAAIWWFLVPILLAVTHRMIPFFSSRVLQNYVIHRPYPLLYLMQACSVLHGALEVAGAQAWLWLADLPFLALSAHFSYHWGLLRSFQVKLLAVLHISYAWLSITLALYVAQSLFLLLGGIHILQLAPLHALGIGFLASMVMAMATRVTLGHSGRDLVCDEPTWIMFLGFQAAVLMRILADMPFIGMPGHLYLAAATLWLLCYLPWAVRYGAIYLRQRIDGRPG